MEAQVRSRHGQHHASTMVATVLNLEFNPAAPNQTCVAEIIGMRIDGGRLCLVAVAKRFLQNLERGELAATLLECFEVEGPHLAHR